MKNFLRHFFSACTLAACTLTITSLNAQQIEQAVEPEQVSKFLDTYIEENQHEVPGGVVTWYQEGQPSYLAGFGISNVKDNMMVSAEQTRFRIASVSKIFAGIAASQLAVNGKLKLDQPIDEYFGNTKILEQLRWPVTMRQLLTHTAGFEDKFYADSTLAPDQRQSLATHLENYLPRQVYQPGALIAYSNYGNALAGLVIEELVGMPFYQYVDENILQPLAMNNSSFILTEEHKPYLAIGYTERQQPYKAKPYTYVHRYPATSMLTTGQDMQRLIKALVSDNSVITTEMQSLLFSEQFSHGDNTGAMGLAFMQYKRSGQTAWWHDGRHIGFSAHLAILPEQKMGYFSAVNSGSSSFTGRMHYSLFKALFEQPAPLTLDKITVNNLSEYAGTYTPTRQNKTTFEAISALFKQDEEITAGNDYLVFHGNKYYPVSENVFREESIGHTLKFATDNGQVTHLFLDWGGAPRALEKRNWFNASTSQQILVLVLLVLSLAMVIATMTRFKRQQQLPAKAAAGFALPNILMCVFTVGLIGFFYTIDIVDVRTGNIPLLFVLLTLPLLALMSLIMLVFKHFKVVKQSRLLQMSLVVAILFVGFFNRYNVIGYYH
ncbi:serine hydrolase domain-containing protein [Thalassotalea ganghwensis]